MERQRGFNGTEVKKKLGWEKKKARDGDRENEKRIVNQCEMNKLYSTHFALFIEK